MLRIAITDDHTLFRKSLGLLINSFENMQVVAEASNGIELLDKLQTVSVDILLLDLQMPEMDGFETARKIRTELPEPQRSIPIIALTANNDAREHERCLAVGMNESMIKPFDRILLSKKVLEHARRRV